MFRNILFTFAIIVHSIGSSSLTSRNPDRKHDPGSSSSVSHLTSVDRTSPQERPLRARSRSPTNSLSFTKVVGCPLEELGFIRLTSRTNHNLRFEFRSHVFATIEPLRYRPGGKKFTPIPKREQIVLLASTGEIFALLEYDGFLRAIHRAGAQNPRVKINMITGAVYIMTPDEKKNCPVGRGHKILNNYIASHVNENSLQLKRNPFSGRDTHPSPIAGQHSSSSTSPIEPSSRARSRSPTRDLPPITVLGYSLYKLGYIRLISRRKGNLQFEFRHYIFPADKPIRLRTEDNRYAPVPAQEKIVVSTSNGDIYAILEYAGFLRGIYKASASNPRVKMNMMSGAVDIMTSDEVKDCPVGTGHLIFPTSFYKRFANHSSLKFQRNLNA